MLVLVEACVHLLVELEYETRRHDTIEICRICYDPESRTWARGLVSEEVRLSAERGV